MLVVITILEVSTRSCDAKERLPAGQSPGYFDRRVVKDSELRDHQTARLIPGLGASAFRVTGAAPEDLKFVSTAAAVALDDVIAIGKGVVFVELALLQIKDTEM
ncbi:hypothetical protein quinque_006458 [Culex quinquefasciatus]